MIVEVEEIGGQLRFRSYNKMDVVPHAGESLYFDDETFMIRNIEWRISGYDFIARLFIEAIK